VQLPHIKKKIATTPISHKHVDTTGGLQNDSSKKKTISECRHRPHESLDLGFHPEDLREIKKHHDSTLNREISTSKMLIVEVVLQHFHRHSLE
jgi:metal-dependent hydrolase (beta-lactamase superfamily II)